MLSAWRGDEANTDGLYDLAYPEALVRGEGRLIGGGAWTRALLYNGLGRYDEALAQGDQIFELDDLGDRGFALAELVEAAARRSSPGLAAGALRELEERTLAAGTEWALGILARSRALLEEGEAAEALYVEAIERLQRTRVVVHACSCPPAVRRVVATREPTDRRPRAASPRARHVPRHGRRVVW